MPVKESYKLQIQPLIPLIPLLILLQPQPQPHLEVPKDSPFSPIMPQPLILLPQTSLPPLLRLTLLLFYLQPNFQELLFQVLPQPHIPQH